MSLQAEYFKNGWPSTNEPLEFFWASVPKESPMLYRAFLIAASLLYVIWPIDIVPDLIPILGWLDDLGVLGYAGYKLVTPSK